MYYEPLRGIPDILCGELFVACMFALHDIKEDNPWTQVDQSNRSGHSCTEIGDLSKPPRTEWVFGSASNIIYPLNY